MTVSSIASSQGRLLAPPSAVVPLHGSFSGHETFVFRYTWLKKGVDGFLADSSVFRQENAIVTLGVGKNMVTSIRHWCLACRVFEEGEAGSGQRVRPLQLSRFGSFLFADRDADGNEGRDPFLEDEATLWLLHWNLVTNSVRATTWYWAFHLLKEPEFTRDGLFSALEKFVQNQNWSRVSENSLRNDVSCFLRTYLPGRRGVASTQEETLDCPLNALSLLVPVGDGARFRFNGKPKPTLPLAVFAFALVQFWESRHPGQATLSVRQIVHEEGSPGRAFRLDEDGVLGYLDELGRFTGDVLRFEDTALVRQVVRRGDVDGFGLLDRYYGRQ